MVIYRKITIFKNIAREFYEKQKILIKCLHKK